MAISCNPNDLAASAKCFKCLPGATLAEVQTYLLCQILNNGGTGGGGGSGSVTSFSAGNLDPLFTTTVINPTTTPALTFTAENQNQNLVYASPDGAPGIPTFRALVASDIPSLSAVYVPVGRTITIAGTANQVISSAGAQDLSANRTWTLSTPQNIDTGAAVQFARLGLGQAASATTPLSILRAAIGSTPSDGLIVTNTTSAAAGAQQYSPAIHWAGNGWKTSGAGSQTVEFRAYVVPVQGASAPTGLLQFESAINGGAFGNQIYMDTSGRLGVNISPTNSQLSVSLINSDFTNTAGADSHLLLNNPSGTQISVCAVFAGTVKGKWRSDSTGNLNWVAIGGSHNFFVNGDFGVGTIIMTLNATSVLVDATNGFSVNGTAGISKTQSPVTSITVSGGIVTAVS